MRWGNWLLILPLLLTGSIISQLPNVSSLSGEKPCVVGCLNAVDACKVGGQVWCIQEYEAPGGLGPGKCRAPRCKEFDTTVTVSYQCRLATGPKFWQYKFKKWYDCNGDGKRDCGCYAAYLCPKKLPKPALLRR